MFPLSSDLNPIPHTPHFRDKGENSHKNGTESQLDHVQIQK